jgi:hypothetical protein
LFQKIQLPARASKPIVRNTIRVVYIGSHIQIVLVADAKERTEAERVPDTIIHQTTLHGQTNPLKNVTTGKNYSSVCAFQSSIF